MRTGRRAFTLVEMLCAIAIIGVLAALLLPALTQARARALRVQCVSQLHQTGLAFHEFAHDHGDLFPMQVPVAAGGSLEYVQRAYRAPGGLSFSYLCFGPLAGELFTPKVLVCPADTRLPAPGFAALSNQNISYFVGVNANYARPNSLLAGDRNLTNDWTGPAALQRLDSYHYLRWTEELHRFKGNVLLADGHVEERNSPGLMPAENQTPETAYLALPVTQPPGAGMAYRPVQNAARSQPASTYVPGLRQQGRGLITATPGAQVSTQGLQPGVVKVTAPAKLDDPKSTKATPPEAISMQAAAGAPAETPAMTVLWKIGLWLWLLLALLVIVGLLRHYGALRSRGSRSRP
jgi:prepilin-type N-terminal cleavage/methylation domain-containing protein/prepilin-type processing-associated H-X9-DG protein